MTSCLRSAVMLLASLWPAVGPVAADVNLLLNPDLEDGLAGWVGHEQTDLAWDADRGKAGAGSLMVPGTGGRQAAFQDVALDAARNLLDFSGWVLCEVVEGDALVALDMGITLDDGQTVWFVPPSAKLAQGASQWQYLSGRYTAPPGRLITGVKFLLLNYRNSAPAWFGNLSLSALHLSMEEAEITIVAAVSEEGRQRQEQLQAVAERLGRPVALVPRVPSFDHCRLLMVPEWQDDDTFLERVKTFYYRGGRLLLGWLPDEGTALAMWYWLFDGVQPVGIALDGTGMAAAWAANQQPASAELTARCERLLATQLQLPPASEPLGDWHAPRLRIDSDAVWVDDRPVLLLAAGAYRVGSGAPSTDMADFAALGMNAVVLYARSDCPMDDMLQVLDAAAEHDLHCLVYLFHGRGTHHPGRPWRAEWIARFAGLSGHPAFLGWVTGDDCFAQHQEMMIRTQQIIRHYDERGLICTTLMDLRRPGRLDAEHWEAWRQAFDFPVTYVYTLQRGDGFQTPSAMEGGLMDLQRLGDNTTESFTGLPHLQWVQAHMQQGMWLRLGLTVAERWLPTPEQQALLSLHALAGGAAGLLYFTHDTITAAAGGLGRRHQLQVLHHQLKPVAEVLLLGQRQHLETDGEAAATLFETGRQTVVLVRRVHDLDQAQVRIGSPVSVSIALPERFEGRTLQRLTPLGTWPLAPARQGRLRLDEFAGWEILGLSDWPEDEAGWAAQLEAEAPAMRQALAEMLNDGYLKTVAVLKVLDRGGLTAQAAGEFVGQFALAEDFLPAMDLPAQEFLELVEARRQLIGRVQEAELAGAEQFWARQSGEPIPEAARTFYGLPQFYQQAGVGLDYEPGVLGSVIAGPEQ